jgi:phage repressor protein C with HTH and peptisase S24 domain
MNTELEYFTAGALAKMGLPGMPGTDAGMRKLAIREGWGFAKHPGRGPNGEETRYRPPASVMALIAAHDQVRIASEYVYTQHPPTRLEVNDHGLASTHGEFVMVPFYDVHASAGHGRFIASQPAVRHYAFDRQWLALQIGLPAHRLALIPVSGNSMEPDLSDGDLVLIDRGDIEVLREGVYVFEVDDGLFVKRLSLRGDKLVIVSTNHDYPIQEVSTLRDNPTFRLHGRVIGSPMFKRF